MARARSNNGASTPGSDEAIVIRGARVHNLKNISLEIPLGEMTVVTGVSGSGKSSLAFDTVYAEGQRRYVESLSAYARQFLERMDRPDVDEVSGICPPIAIRQKNATRNPRSTVATQTEIHDYLRLLFARVGETFCMKCGQLVKRDTPQSIAQEVLALPEGTRFYVLFPASAGMEIDGSGNLDKPGSRQKPAALPGGRGSKPPGNGARGITAKKARSSSAALKIKAHLMSLMQRGFTRLYHDGRVIELTSPDSFNNPSFDNTFVLVDRLKVSEEVQSRLVDSIETCYHEGHGQVVIETAEEPRLHLRYSEGFECKTCSLPCPTPEPRLFSFNNPFGACPVCQGFGNSVGLDIDLVIPNRDLSLADGAIEPWTRPQYQYEQKHLLRFCAEKGIPAAVPFRELTREQQRAVIYGKNNDGAGYDGVAGFFASLEEKKYRLHVRVFLAKYRGYTTCQACSGSRLRPEALQVKVSGKTLADIGAMTAAEAHNFFDGLVLGESEAEIAGRLLNEIRDRLRFLLDVGLDYLTMDRLASTLSGGEAQRIQLASSLGSSLVGALYVLDEPSIGLHPRDNAKLIRILRNLRDIGNTVLVVEHEPEMILSANHILDIGPGAGESGGEVVFSGSTEALLRDPGSLTARYLRGELEVKPPKPRGEAQSLPGVSRGRRYLKVSGAREHNLRGIDVHIPLGLQVCITGVSGSGKSTLVHDCIYAALKKRRGEWSGKVGQFSRMEGAEYIDDVILVDQSPIGRTPRSNPVTYIKAYDAIRDLFASTREAQARGYDSSHFSFNVPGGRCERCEGNGVEIKEMQFLADVELTCEECRGTRFKSGVLEVRYKGKSIFDALNLTVREGLTFFSASNRIASRLRVLDDVGLGYLRLGQSATTLSGGEAQRVKLAAHLTRRASDRSLYVFDEPTTGLHFDDINKLLAALRQLCAAGGSLLIIEHNLDVIRCADWIIDLGPGGGDQGGSVVAAGPPEAIMDCESSYTGRFLKEYLGHLQSLRRGRSLGVEQTEILPNRSIARG